MTSLLKPASQVGDALGLVPSLLHSLAGQAPGLVPEGGDMHSMAPAPPEVAAIDSWVAVQELQVGGQGGGNVPFFIPELGCPPTTASYAKTKSTQDPSHPVFVLNDIN